VTVTDTDTFTYTVDSGLAATATGTPVVSYVAIHELTTAGGVANVTRTFGANQQMKGWARKSNTSSPFYQQASIGFTVDNVNGNVINLTLAPDE
jgi:hypothetical protein